VIPLLVSLWADVAPAAAPSMAANEANKSSDANVVFAEALGNGLLYPINYERVFGDRSYGLRAGASYFTHSVSTYGGSGNLVLVSFPLVASYYVGWEQHKVQLGLGATILYLGASTDSQNVKFESDKAGLGVAATGVFGYRYMPRASGLVLGAAFTPLLRPGKLLPWGGVNVGYVF